MSVTQSKRITRYWPNQRHDVGFIQTWGIMAQNVYRSRELVWQLFKRDFFAAYKKSFIGFTWIFLAPVLGIVSWVFLDKAGILQPGDTGEVPYPAYVLIGSAMWGLFMGFYNSGAGTLSAGKSFVMQVNYPHEVLLFKQLAQTAANFSLSLITNIVVLLAFGVVPSWKIIFLPLVVLPMFFLAAAVGLVFSMIAVVAIDLNKAVAAGIGILLYSMPIIYSGEPESEFVRTIIKWNPLTYLICSARDTILYGTFYNKDPKAYLLCAGGTLLVFLISWRLFYVSENKIIERMI